MYEKDLFGTSSVGRVNYSTLDGRLLYIFLNEIDYSSAYRISHKPNYGSSAIAQKVAWSKAMAEKF